MQVGWIKVTHAGTINVRFKNFGNTVASDVKIISGFASTENDIELTAQESDGIVPQGMSKTVTWKLEDEYVQAILIGMADLFIHVRIQWYALDNKQFEYECVGQYVNSHQTFATLKSDFRQIQRSLFERAID